MITLSPETEADIRELLRLWGWDANDQVKAEAVARGVLKDGLREFIKARRKRNAEQAIPQKRAGRARVRGKDSANAVHSYRQ